VYLLALAVIWPVGDFVINDDWAFTRQIETGLTGNIKLSSFITASFISQEVLGIIWSLVFGFSLSNLRWLTIAITAGLLVVIYKILKVILPYNNKLNTCILLAVLFNPYVFHLSMSFMSDNYFVFFYVLSLYYFLIKRDTLGLLFASIAFLTRQIGIVLFIAYFMQESYKLVINKQKTCFKKLTFLIISLVISFVLLKVWPRYNSDTNSMGFLSFFADLSTLTKNASKLIYVPFYFAYFLSPVIFFSYKKFNLKHLLWMIPLLILSSNLLFKVDVLPLRNVYNLEGLNTLANYVTTFSFFNNIPVKIFASVFISTAFVFMLKELVTLAFQPQERHKLLGENSVFLTLNWLGLLFIVVLGNDFYDRHLLPTILVFYLWFTSLSKEKLRINNVGLIALSILVFHTFALQSDFINVTRLSWNQATKTQKEKSIINQIYVNGPFAKYYNAQKSGDYTGEVASEPAANYLCYTREYIENNPVILQYLEKLNAKIERRIGNPVPPDSRKNTNIPSARKNLENMTLQDYYFSFRYGLLGRKTSVVTWCSEKHKMF
jgi:hypothetical protein